MPLVEIRSYNLNPGTREEFHRLMTDVCVPMLRRWEVDVPGFGPSPHDDESYFLIRAYASLEQRQRSQDEFYASAEWKEGPRKAVLAKIASYTSIVLQLDEATVAGLRAATR